MLAGLDGMGYAGLGAVLAWELAGVGVVESFDGFALAPAISAVSWSMSWAQVSRSYWMSEMASSSFSTLRSWLASMSVL